MAVPAKLVMIAAFSLLLVEGARAQQTQAAAAPADRCEGTLCDLYYGNRAPDAGAAKPAATPAMTQANVPPGATVLTAPTGNPLGKLFGGGGSGSGSGGGGGVSSWFGGSGTRSPPPESEPASATNSYMHMGTGGLLGDSKRCSGTLCDVYYGSSPSEPAPAQQQASTAAGGYVAAAAPATPAVPHRHIVHESETRPKCSSPTADPWHCYR